MAFSILARHSGVCETPGVFLPVMADSQALHPVVYPNLSNASFVMYILLCVYGPVSYTHLTLPTKA